MNVSHDERKKRLQHAIDSTNLTITNAELAKIYLHQELAQYQVDTGLELTHEAATSYPPCHITSHGHKDTLFWQFSYEGMLPLFNSDPDHHKSVRDAYQLSTIEAVKKHEIEPNNSKVFIYIVHYFKNNVIRDLDNRNRKYLIDALRYALVIPDDRWQNISIMEEGCLDKERDHVEVFVGTIQHKWEIMNFVESENALKNYRNKEINDTRTMSDFHTFCSSIENRL